MEIEIEVHPSFFGLGPATSLQHPSSTLRSCGLNHPGIGTEVLYRVIVAVASFLKPDIDTLQATLGRLIAVIPVIEQTIDHSTP